MKPTILAAAMAALLSATACTAVTDFVNKNAPTGPAPTDPSPPIATPTDPDKIGDRVCQVYDTISWAVPAVEGLVQAGVHLKDWEQKALDNAVDIVNAGCEADSATWRQRAAAAAKVLLNVVDKFDPLQLQRARMAPEVLTIE